MNHQVPEGMREALRLTKAGRLKEATTAILRSLSGGQGGHDAPPAAEAGQPPTIDGTAEWVDVPLSSPRSAVPGPVPPREAAHGSFAPGKMGRRDTGAMLVPPFLKPAASAASESPAEGRFLTAVFGTPNGGRPYKLYIPAGYRAERPMPLIVMLHGCTQSPDDFAAGTRMNQIAGAQGCLVAWPAQIGAANAQKCWNWFNPSDQRRDGGEPALIAGITREVMAAYAVDPRRVYVAGLSAGGAAAAIMGRTYPDLYAAVGVHSGLACGAASDMPSAFAAMKRGVAGSAAGRGDPPVIVFHGDRDTTVNPRNADAVAGERARDPASRPRVEEGRTPGGHAWRRVTHGDTEGRVMVEQWTIHGAGHAWSGGSAAGSYTDPHGPDASREMLRFFLEHPRPEPG